MINGHMEMNTPPNFLGVLPKSGNKYLVKFQGNFNLALVYVFLSIKRVTCIPTVLANAEEKKNRWPGRTHVMIRRKHRYV
jgi:hypothetical protein